MRHEHEHRETGNAKASVATGSVAASPSPVPSREAEPSIVRATLRALLKTRRLAAIALVSAALVGAQASFSADRWGAPLGLLMCFLFVVVAPVSWRVLFPDGRLDLRHGGIRLALYGAIGAGVVSSVGVVLPQLLGMRPTLLTAPSSVLVCLALFLVGGWGLARDIWLESSLVRSEARAAAFAREAERTQLLAFRSHLDPHFLFNTLNAIAEWCRDDGEVAERAVLELAAMLRVVLGGIQVAAWPLREELALVETLFSLHRLRDPERLRLVRRLPAPLPEITVPPLLLLPLAENAFKHGLSAGWGGLLELEVVEARHETATSQGEDAPAGWVLRLVNDGPFAGRRPGGLGLDLVERRLALAYDGRATFRIEGAGDRTIAEIVIPPGAKPHEERL